MAVCHCESCGEVNPDIDDGYTCCCNELVCDGSARDKFGIPGDFVVACCWARAEEKFKVEKREVPEGSYRLD